jgi:two-component system, response regulator
MIIDQAVDVLLVEDDEADAELILRAMKQRNVAENVVHVLDGDEALDFVFASHIDGCWDHVNAPRLIVLDLKLRKVSGLEVLRELKFQERTKVIPVVVLTGSREEIKNVESYRLGVNSYVIKPTDSQMYFQVIGDIAHYWLSVNEPPQR